MGVGVVGVCKNKGVHYPRPHFFLLGVAFNVSFIVLYDYVQRQVKKNGGVGSENLCFYILPLPPPPFFLLGVAFNVFFIVLYDYVWSCVIMYDYVWLCMIMYDYVWLFDSTTPSKKNGGGGSGSM